MKADTTIIVPQHGHGELTRQCLASLRRFDAIPWPVVVVDDGSPVGCGRQFDIDPYSPARLVAQTRLGVSAAWNRGATEAETAYLLFLNNDTISTGPWVDRLIAPLREHSCVMTGVRNRVERAWPASLAERLGDVQLMEGWCFAISRRRFDEIGCFDESLRVYWSDTDLQLRLVSESSGEFETTLQAMTDLPLRHLGHRTAHDRTLLPQRKTQWVADRAAFIEKWERVLGGNVEFAGHLGNRETTETQRHGGVRREAVRPRPERPASF